MANNTGKKYGGRKQGTPNKNTAMVRFICNYLVDDGYERFKYELNKLEGEKYVRCFLELAKLASSDATTEVMANQKLIELFNQKIKQNGTNK